MQQIREKKLFDIRKSGLSIDVLRTAMTQFYGNDREISTELYVLETRSYPIYGNMYRHTYIRINDRIEIHPGLPQRVTWRDYYLNAERVSRDRCVGVRYACRACTDNFLASLHTHMRYFNLALNNCDTMVGDSRQTLVTWLFCTLIVVGGIIWLPVGLIGLVVFATILTAVKLRNSRSNECTSSRRPRYPEIWRIYCPHTRLALTSVPNNLAVSPPNIS